MPLEIERKFLVKESWKAHADKSVSIIQGYLSSNPDRIVRVRIADKRGFLTVKGKSNNTGLSRYEWETEIPFDVARELMCLSETNPVEKTRYFIPSGNYTIEVDVFHGANVGLIIAEVELSMEDESFDKPGWIGKEISNDHRYSNVSLSKLPYTKWK